MATTLDFYQIYFDDSQVQSLYDFAIPYRNEVLTPAFENDIILKLVPESKSDLISVCSHALRRKRGDTIHVKNELTRDNIVTNDFDVAILTPRSPRHQPLLMASNWHGKAWDDAIKDLRSKIRIPKELRYTIYENHFIAKKSIYHEYCNFLREVLTYCNSKDVYFADSGYIRKVRDHAKIERVQKSLGRKDWPILPFILERLFSIWIEDKNLNVINL